jgi:hypothetical protein
LILIYSHKPQRSGRGISTNTNNPPQDPPPPKEENIPIAVEEKSEIIQTVPEITVPKKTVPKIEKQTLEVPDVPIKDTTPPVPEVCPEEKPVLPKEIKTKLITEPKPKVTITTQIKTTKQPEPKPSWFARLITRIKGFFGR